MIDNVTVSTTPDSPPDNIHAIYNLATIQHLQSSGYVFLVFRSRIEVEPPPPPNFLRAVRFAPSVGLYYNSSSMMNLPEQPYLRWRCVLSWLIKLQYTRYQHEMKLSWYLPCSLSECNTSSNCQDVLENCPDANIVFVPFHVMKRPSQRSRLRRLPANCNIFTSLALFGWLQLRLRFSTGKTGKRTWNEL